MPNVRVTRKVHFSAGHQLRDPDLDADRNRALFGGCANPHGHNYDLYVTVEGEVDPRTGYAFDLGRLKALLHTFVVDDVDHADLNADVAWLRDVNPTAENVAVRIWHRLEGKLDDARLIAVRLHETDRNIVEYRGE